MSENDSTKTINSDLVAEIAVQITHGKIQTRVEKHYVGNCEQWYIFVRNNYRTRILRVKSSDQRGLNTILEVMGAEPGTSMREFDKMTVSQTITLEELIGSNYARMLKILYPGPPAITG